MPTGASTLETAACIIGGIALIACGLGLARLRPPNWQDEGELIEDEKVAILRWAKVQRFVRFLNNSIICITGLLIAVTGIVAHGQAWVILWSAILLLLMICILLAMIDAMSSLAGYKRALPEAARRSLGSRELAGLAMEATATREVIADEDREDETDDR